MPSKKRKRTKDGEGVAREHKEPARQRRRRLPNDRDHDHDHDHLQSADAVKHAVLAQYYPKVVSLRQYLLDNLPPSSRIRRRKIEAFAAHVPEKCRGDDHARLQLAKLLDTTLIGLHACPEQIADARSKSRLQQWTEYSQKDDSHATISKGEASSIHFLSEIVDFVIWLSFSRAKPPNNRPNNLLCDGYRKSTRPGRQGALSSIQGVYNLHFNERVGVIKQSPWPQLLLLLGNSGESIMIKLLLDCAIFLRVEAGHDSYYQLSGAPIFECAPLASKVTSASHHNASEPFERKPAEIVFVRNRMLYARAALNARGQVHFGLRHIHALNRFPLRRGSENCQTAIDDDDDGAKPVNDTDSTIHIMMYMFPRQFGLHNVFTSHVDMRKTAQKFQDYTLREEEITFKFPKTVDGNEARPCIRVPKRLRGELEHMIQRLQSFHARCSYAQLLQHYCPIGHMAPEASPRRHSGSAKAAVTSTNKLSGKNSRGRKKYRQSQPGSQAIASTQQCSSLTELAAPVAHVSSFCQAVLSKIIPHAFWGHADVQQHNRQTFLRNIDRFVRLRRFETISLHDVTQGLKITEIEWLVPPALRKQKCSRTDFRKRSEILHEFVYYVFDSILIPLIRSNFYVTESSAHRYRLFFFRHDVWRSISEPAMAELKAKMFVEVKPDQALTILDSQRLGYSLVRLLPKQATVRPIMNLRRRTFTRKDKKTLGQSINSILGPVYSMLKLEKSHDASRLGSAMFSVGEIYDRINKFKQRIGSSGGPFFFAKIDVQGAFDTIPQDAVIALMSTVPSEAYYEIIKHVELRPNDNNTLTNSTVSKRWHASAMATGDPSTFLKMIDQQTAASRKSTIYVDSVYRKTHRTRDLLALMGSHIQQNLVKIGKKYYRQKNGIPQGSVLSSLLCSYFYADLERKKLHFLQADDCLLLRLIDDFLLITTDKTKAARFVTVMQHGVPEYGVTVSPPKTLVNFAMSSDIDGLPVPRTITTTTNPISNSSHIHPDVALFPYCGTQINTRTLEISKDRSSSTTSTVNARKDPTLANALTVEHTRKPGANFTRKVLNAFKLQAHLMFFDTRHNATRTVLQNLRDALTETAAKAWAYARCLRPSVPKKGGGSDGGLWAPPTLWRKTITELGELAYRLITSRARREKYPGYECRVTRAQVRWLALGAFREVLGRKQAGFAEVLTWLDREMCRMEAEETSRSSGGDIRRLDTLT